MWVSPKSKSIAGTLASLVYLTSQVTGVVRIPVASKM
jgi:hypothetical protein